MITWYRLTRWKHQVEIVSHILIYIGERISITSIVNVDAIIVIVIGINVVVNVKYESDY